MDAVGSNRTALFGSSEGGAMCLLFAATYPERTAALVLGGAYPARHLGAPDYPWGQTEVGYRLELARDLSLFGPREQALEAVHTRMLVDDEEAEQWLDYFRWSGSPGAVEALPLMNKEIENPRHVLPAIRVPTLLLHRSGDLAVPPDVARYMAERIPRRGSGRAAGHRTSRHRQLRRQPGVGDRAVPHRGLGVRRLGGDQAGPRARDGPGSPTSSVRASEPSRSATGLGASCSKRHRGPLRRQLARFRGREVDNAGDGFFASFDETGPGDPVRPRRRRQRSRTRHRATRWLAYRRVRTGGWQGCRDCRAHRRANRLASAAG